MSVHFRSQKNVRATIMRPFLSVLTLAAILGSAGFADAQNVRPGSGSNDSPARSMMASFDRNAPGVGEPVPDIDVLDAQGNPFPLRRLKDNYSVLVFGCLT